MWPFTTTENLCTGSVVAPTAKSSTTSLFSTTSPSDIFHLARYHFDRRLPFFSLQSLDTQIVLSIRKFIKTYHSICLGVQTSQFIRPYNIFRIQSLCPGCRQERDQRRVNRPRHGISADVVF